MVLALGLLGCTLQGAGDPFPDAPGLTADEVAQCSQGTLPERARAAEGEQPIDRTAGGRLKGAAKPVSGRPLTHVVALDYSGSMFGGYERADESAESTQCGWRRSSRGGKLPNGPFYWNDPAFDDFLGDTVLSTVGAADPTYAMVFNKDVFVLDGTGATTWADGFSSLPAGDAGGDSVLKQLTGPAAGGTLAAEPWQAKGWGTTRMWDESQMSSVLDAAAWVFEQDDARDGVLWIVTDNIIDTGVGDLSQEAEYNRAFYQKLKSDPRWQVVYAYPVHQADWLCGSTLLVYGMYYSSRERIDQVDYRALTEGQQGRLSSPQAVAGFAKVASDKSPSPGHPFKLKPDDLDLIQPDFEGVVDCGPARVTGQARTCTAKVSLDNLLMHRRVTGATLNFNSSRIDAWDRSQVPPEPVVTAVPLGPGVVTSTASLENPIEPHDDKVIEVQLLVPPVETELHSIRDRWESAQHPRFGMVGLMQVDVTDLTTEMAISADDLGDVYGVAALPEIFRNPNTDHLSSTVCLQMAVDNPSYFSSVALLLLLGVGGLGFVVGGWLLRPTWRHVVVDGTPQEQIRLTRLIGATVNVDGRAVAKARLTARGQVKLRAIPPWRLTSRGSAWELKNRSEEFDSRRKLELKSRGARGTKGGSTRNNSDF